MPLRRFLQSLRGTRGEREPGFVGWMGSPPGQLVLLVLGVGLIFLTSTMALRSTQESPGPPLGAIRSVAILPLANQTGDPDREPFVDGLHDALIAELAGLPGLSVISRSSVLRYRDSRAPLSRIAADLGVDAVVQGSVQRSLGSVAVVARLVQADPERQIWSGRYEGSDAIWRRWRPRGGCSGTGVWGKPRCGSTVRRGSGTAGRGRSGRRSPSSGAAGIPSSCSSTGPTPSWTRSRGDPRFPTWEFPGTP